MKNTNNTLKKLFKEAKRTKPKLKLTVEQMDKFAENPDLDSNQIVSSKHSLNFTLLRVYLFLFFEALYTFLA